MTNSIFSHLAQRFKIRVRTRIIPDSPAPHIVQKTARLRLFIAGLLACLCFAGIGAKAMYLAQHNVDRTRMQHAQNLNPRGVIYDMRGRVMAHSVPVKILYLDPEQMLQPDKVATALSPYLPAYSRHDILRLLSRKTRYIELDRKITPQRHAQILQLGLTGVFFKDSYMRSYPQGFEAAHILGKTDSDGVGISGIEKQFDQKLAAGQDVHLSIDLGVQAIVRQTLHAQIEKFEAKGGAGLVFDMDSGEMRALVSLPDYDPNHFNHADKGPHFNHASKGVFEMGSIFKILNTAIALETGVATLSSSYDVTDPLKIAGFSIHDYRPHEGALNLSEVMIYSSNIGSAQIAQAIGPHTQKSYMHRLGLLKRPALEIPETSKPLAPKIWEQLSAVTISYGHGLSVSAIHAVAALAAAAGEGHYIEPTLLRRPDTHVTEHVRVFSASTVQKIRSMMRLVVAHPAGTANFAETPGYFVGAKTGTAEKVSSGRYDRGANLTSVIAAFPIYDPKYLVFIMIDEPQPQAHAHGFATAGWVAAPVIPAIITQAAPILGLLPIDINQPEIRQRLEQNLEPELHIGGEGVFLASF